MKTLFYLVAKLVGGEGEDGKVARELEESMLVFKNIFRIDQCSFMICQMGGILYNSAIPIFPRPQTAESKMQYNHY